MITRDNTYLETTRKHVENCPCPCHWDGGMCPHCGSRVTLEARRIVRAEALRQREAFRVRLASCLESVR